ncbi:MAG: type IX secretion system sortase PorU [Candidatus Krumholzibacteria bacterium]|nr:type IX secretion system sortase PorU [Candidatus Krumholzibacteria bacterium]
MRRILFLALAISFFAAESRCGEYRILSEDETGLTVEFRAASPLVSRAETGGGAALASIRIQGYLTERLEGRPVLPVQRYFFQVPAGGAAGLQVVDLDAAPLEGVVPEVWFGAGAPAEEHLRALSDPASARGRDFAVIAGSGRFRHRDIVMVDIYPVIWNPAASTLLYADRIVVRLSFPPASRGTAGARPSGIHDGFIVNASQAAGWGAEGPARSPSLRTPFEFSYSDRWLRLNISSTGIHTLTYSDLLGAGIDPSTIDPATLRLFSAGPLQQPDLVDDGGSFGEDFHLGETAIIYSGSNSGEFLPGESMVFYALGAKGWTDAVDPSAAEHEYYEHYYDRENVYWLTWGGSFSGEPARMEPRDVSPAGSPPDVAVDRYTERIHREENNLYDPKYTDDRWYWRSLGVGTTTFSDNFTLTGATGAGRVRALIYGPYNSFYTNHATYYLNNVELGSFDWITTTYYFLPDTLDVDVSNLVNDTNILRVTKGSSDKMYIMWHDIFYERYLAAAAGKLDFFGPAAQGRAGFTMTGFPSGALYLLDVTDWRSPVLLEGWEQEGGTVEFEDARGGARAHYAAAVSSALMKPRIEVAGLYPGDLESLRDDPSSPHMVIIYNSRFQNAAGALASFRSGRLPGVEAPRVKTVDIEEVYDNFSGGMKDPVAVRNYMKYLHDNFTENGEPAIRYLLLMGNGTYDPMDILGTGNDFVPLYMKDYGREIVEDEDYFVRMDEGGDRLADIAVGRMTVLTASEAAFWVGQIARYESGADHGEWRNKVVLAADDEHSASTDCDFSFMLDTEALATGYEYFPGFIDRKKIYLHHYPFSGDLKPDATRDLLDEWNAGALIVNYTGHGSPQQMSDERVMQKSDVYSLINGSLRPLFTAFSCSVGNIESPYQRSIAQELVVRQDGGAIAAISGTGGTLGVPNRELSNSIFRSLFTSADSTGTEPLGITMLIAKPCCDDFAGGMNNAQYILIGDPATTLAMPGYKVEHNIAAIDTMYKGDRYHIEGSVVSGGNRLDSFTGTARVIVQESTEEIDEGTIPCYYFQRLAYSIPGKEIFRGTFDVAAGRFSADFTVPVRCRGGSRARVRTYVEASGMDGIGAEDSLVILNNPNTPVNEGPPEINIYFSGQATKVKQGATLNVEISDPDGIAILGGDPQSSIFLEFDKSGYPIFVTDYFTYDHGSSSTGRVEYPLHSGFTPGPHQVVVRAFDNLGESATDTLSFDVIEEGLYTVSDVFNMPNPFRDSTNFVFQLSSEADVTLRIYNVSGRQIWHSSLQAVEGFNSIYWDGRDSAGDRPANGTYLYVLDVSFRNSFNRTESVTGKAVLLR